MATRTNEHFVLPSVATKNFWVKGFTLNRDISETAARRELKFGVVTLDFFYYISTMKNLFITLLTLVSCVFYSQEIAQINGVFTTNSGIPIKKPRSSPGPSDGDWRSKARLSGFCKHLRWSYLVSAFAFLDDLPSRSSSSASICAITPRTSPASGSKPSSMTPWCISLSSWRI